MIMSLNCCLYNVEIDLIILIIQQIFVWIEPEDYYQEDHTRTSSTFLKVLAAVLNPNISCRTEP